MINTPTIAVACYDDSGLEQRSTHYVISAPHTPTHTRVQSQPAIRVNAAHSISAPPFFSQSFKREDSAMVSQ